MGNYEQLKQSVSDVIKTNGNREITGSILQNVLLTIISTVGANATFVGIATPVTNPGTPDGPVFYLASESGTYTNFNAIELQDGLSVLMWNGSWSSQQIFGVDDEPTAGSDNLVKSGGVFNSISNLNYLEGKTSYSVYSENDYINYAGYVQSGGNGKMTDSIVLPPGTTITAVCRGFLTNVAIISEVIEEGARYRVLVRSEDSSIHAYSYTNYDINDKNISISYVGSSDSLVLFLESIKERKGYFTKNFTSIESPTRYIDGIVKAEAYATSDFLESIGTNLLTLNTGYYQPNGRFYIQLKKPGTGTMYIDESVVVGDTAPTDLFEMYVKDDSDRYVIHLIVDCNIIPSLVNTGLDLHFADMSFIEQSESGAIQNIQSTKTIENTLEASRIKNALSPVIANNDAYINPVGYITSGGGAFYTEPITLSPKCTILVKAKSFKKNVSIISEVVTEGSLYKPLVIGIDTTVRVYSYTNNTDSDLQIALSGLNEGGLEAYTVINISKLAEATPTVAFDKTMQYQLINPLHETMDMLGIVKDWGFIGDSLNSGEIYYKRTSDNVTISGDMYAWSWGQNICQLCGTIGTNFSVGGLTAKSWINTYWNTSFNGYKTGGRGETFNASPKQVYTICLGTNDINAMIRGDMNAEARAAYIGSWEDVDINDFSNNADTFYGNYSGIIQRIKSIQPSAKIFLINIFSIFHRSDIRFEINAAISEIHSHFTNTFLVDLETLAPVSKTIIDKYGNGHFKVQGYMWFSYVVGNIINRIIRDNVSAFNSLPFIGVEGKDDGTL